MRKYRNYTDQDIINIAKTVYSIAGLLKALDLKPAGGNYANVKRIIQRLNIDTSHWKSQGWNKGKQLKDWKDYARAVRLKPHLIKIRSHTCEICKNDFPMKFLEVDHKDGGVYSLKKVEDIQDFFVNICIVCEDDLRVVCKDCHSCLSYSAKKGCSFEEARIQKEFIEIKKQKKVVDKLISLGVNSIPKLKKDQESLCLKLMSESVNEN